MWYFAWILGLGLACSVGIINAMWLALQGYPAEQAVK
jgi:cyd operon protein YbgT